MPNKLYEEASVQAIANAIRSKNGTTTTYKIGEMAAAIDGLANVEAHVVTFAEDVTCAKGSTVDLCDTNIQKPVALGMVTYADGTTGDPNVPVLAFGVGHELSKVTPTSGYACGTSNSSYATDSKGYVMLYSGRTGMFNSEFGNGMFVRNGKLKWNNIDGLGYSEVSAKFPAGVRYIFFILGASA